MTKPIITSDKETRYITSHKVEVRANEDGTPSRTIVFYASVFNTRSNMLSDWGGDGFREVIDPAAFNEVLEQDTTANVDHDDARIIARSTAGNLRLSVDNIGLRCEADVPNTSAGNDLLENIRVGNIRQSSFCFQLAPEGDSWTYSEKDGYMRTIKKISRLWDVSMVVWPAYNEAGIAPEDAKRNTQVAARSLQSFIETSNPLLVKVKTIDEVRSAELRLQFRRKY
jgi:HK97 family phage prohead protease